MQRRNAARSAGHEIADRAAEERDQPRGPGSRQHGIETVSLEVGGDRVYGGRGTRQQRLAGRLQRAQGDVQRHVRLEGAAPGSASSSSRVFCEEPEPSSTSVAPRCGRRSPRRGRGGSPARHGSGSTPAARVICSNSIAAPRVVEPLRRQCLRRRGQTPRVTSARSDAGQEVRRQPVLDGGHRVTIPSLLTSLSVPSEAGVPGVRGAARWPRGARRGEAGDLGGRRAHADQRRRSPSATVPVRAPRSSRARRRPARTRPRPARPAGGTRACRPQAVAAIDVPSVSRKLNRAGAAGRVDGRDGRGERRRPGAAPARSRCEDQRPQQRRVDHRLERRAGSRGGRRRAPRPTSRPAVQPCRCG